MRQSILLLIVIILFSGFQESLRSKVMKGNQAMRAGNYEEALVQYADAELSAPQSPELYYNIGNALYHQRKYVDANGYYEQSQTFGDESFDHISQFNQACILYREGKLEESLGAFKTLLDTYPEDEDIKYNVEFIEQKMKEMLNESEKTKERMEQQRQQQNQQQQQNQEDEDNEEGKNEPEKSESPQGGESPKEDEKKEEDVEENQPPQPESKPDKPEEKQEDSSEKEGEEKASEDEKEKENEEPGEEEKEEESKDEPEENEEDKDQEGDGSGKGNTPPPESQENEGDSNSNEMSQEEAENFLDLLDHQMQDAPLNPNRKKVGYGNYRQAKDW